MPTQASSKVQDEILLTLFRDLGGVMDEDVCVPQSKGAQPFLTATPPDFSRSRCNFFLAPLEVHDPT